jgi:1,4-alpha-glucan branching enzyme
VVKLKVLNTRRKDERRRAKLAILPACTATKRKQSFSFVPPTAMTVQLLGDFTQWQQNPINLKKREDGIWRTTVELPPGEHHYRFMVDGHWRDDPECVLRVPNPHGSENMVRRVP